MDVERRKEEVIWEGCVGLSWTDPGLMKSQRGRETGWYRADNACCQPNERALSQTHTRTRTSQECATSVINDHNRHIPIAFDLVH